MRIFGIKAAMAVATFAVMAPAIAAAAPPDVWGSAVYLTSRNCNGIASGADCLGAANPNIHIVQDQFDGGAGVASHAAMAVTTGGLDRASVTWGALDLPVIKASVTTGADNRNNTNSYGYQSFVYTGAAATPFALTSTLDFTSSAAPVMAGLAQTDPPLEVGGEGYAFVRFGLMDPGVVTGLVTAQDIFNYGFGADCGSAGVLGVAQYRYATAGGGAGGGSLTLDTACGGGALTLTPGEEFLVFLLEQTPANRGGFVDASHTLRLALADSLTDEQQATIRAGLVSARDSVPEPQAWALLILGFAGVGASLRRRRAVLAA